MSGSTSTESGVLLDTNVIVGHFRTPNGDILGQLESGYALYMPLTVLGELYTGVYRGSERSKTLREIQSFLTMVAIIRPDEATAEHYGQIQVELAKAGTPIPQNDAWIAALAREHQLPLASRDGHFKLVAGLTIFNW